MAALGRLPQLGVASLHCTGRGSVRFFCSCRCRCRCRLRGNTFPSGRRRAVRLRCDYSSSNSSLPTIDVVAEVRSEKVLVLGGSGFVGSAVCKAAIRQGIEVVSLSRSGRPSDAEEPWADQVLWITGNVFYADWDGLLKNATAVISTIGGFGTIEEMEKINGEANVVAVNAAAKAGVRKFIYISVHSYNLPEFVLNVGYFSGKRRAEKEILFKYPNSGTILKPGLIYGKRRVNGIEIDLDVVGEVMESAANILKPLASLPGLDTLIVPPINVSKVGAACVKAVVDDSMFGVFTIEQIEQAAASLH